eukprot:scaffold260_cov390-Pavlova_lutheri.AAC.4
MFRTFPLRVVCGATSIPTCSFPGRCRLHPKVARILPLIPALPRVAPSSPCNAISSRSATRASRPTSMAHRMKTGWLGETPIPRCFDWGSQGVVLRDLGPGIPLW